MRQDLVDVIIPVYRAKDEIEELIKRLEAQSIPPERIIIMHTVSKGEESFFDAHPVLLGNDKIKVFTLSPQEFDHGKTRDLGIKESKSKFFLCMTQDALPKDHLLIEKLLSAVEKENTAVSYARQLPRENAHPLEVFNRVFNYPKISIRKTIKDLPEMGIKTYFCSNVCAMYNRMIYDRLGGFIQQTIFNEDMIFAAKAVQSGYEIAYEAEAKVIHSHHYTGAEQFRRNFDLGVSQADHPEIFEQVRSEKEGKRLVMKTFAYLKKEKKMILVPVFIFHTVCKYAGYKLGKNYRKISPLLVKKWSMNKQYWTS